MVHLLRLARARNDRRDPLRPLASNRRHLTGLLTLGLFVQLRFRTRVNRPPLAFGYLALGLVIVQGALGGATVLLRLPPAASEAHLMVGRSFFATTLWLAWSIRQGLQRKWRRRQRKLPRAC
jgi:heme A synthase